jgi:hypothetical protein
LSRFDTTLRSKPNDIGDEEATSTTTGPPIRRAAE